MKKLALIRLESGPSRTLGHLLVFNGLTEIAKFASLELPWLNNERSKSCIPAGKYRVSPRYSDKLGNHLLIEGVPGRDLICIHAANYPSQIEGCVAVGMMHADLNGDGLMDVSSSRAALELLVQFVREPADLVVIDG